MVLFKHIPTGRIRDLPAHYATAKVAKNYELLEGEYEEDKVVISHDPYSLSRSVHVVRDEEPEVVDEFIEETD